MTKNFKSYVLSTLAVAAIALSSCSKSDEGMTPAQKKDFSVVLTGVSTKTTNDGMSTLWAANDAINLFHAPLGGEATTGMEYVSDGEFSTTQSGATATFTGTLAADFDETLTYNWYAFYPYTKQITTPANSSAGYTYVGGRSDRSQTQTGNNSTAHICGTNYPIAGILNKVAGSEKPVITMRHLSSLVAVKVTNGLKADPITVSKVSITADGVDIVGSYYIDFTDPNNPSFVPSNTNYVSSTANLEVTDGEAIAAGESATFYLAVKPFTVNEGDDFTVSVTATNGAQEKVISAPKNYTFAAGKKKTINFTYDKSVLTYDFTTVAELNALKTSTPTSHIGKLTNAVVSFVPDEKNAVIKDATGSVLYYLNGGGMTLKQGQTINGDVNVTLTTYNNCSEVTAFNATVSGEGAVVEPQTVTLADLAGNLETWQNAYVKVTEGLEVTAINGKNITVKKGSNTYVVYSAAAAVSGLAVGDVITSVVGTIANFSGNDQIKAWKVADIEFTHTATEHTITIVQPTDAGSSYITVKVGGSEITSGAKFMEGTEVQAEITIDGYYDFTTWDITGAVNLSSKLSHVVTFEVGTEDITIKANLVKRGAKSYTITWNSTNNSQSIGSYTATWSVTADGLTCNMANWNNNNNKWNYVKCGRKDNASVATITTASAISEAIKKVTMTIDNLTASKINSITLYSSDSADSGWVSIGTFTIASGDQSVTIASPAANKYYKLDVDCAAGTANGLLTLSKLVFSE